MRVRLTLSNSSGAASVTITDPALTFIANGEDPQGMGDIQIWIEETWWRSNPDDGTESQTGPGLLGKPEKSNPVPPGSRDGCTQRLTSLNLDATARRKGATRYRIRAWAVALNTAGGATQTGDLTLTWP